MKPFHKIEKYLELHAFLWFNQIFRAEIKKQLVHQQN